MLINILVLKKKKILEQFKERVTLEKILEESISFNQKLLWDNSNGYFKLATTVEELIDVFKLRSDIYTQLNYDNEFPDIIKGLNFDTYDENSAVLYTQVNNELTGTCRLIFDSNKKLPTEKEFSFDYMRSKYKNIAEVSRLIIKHKTGGLNLEFKNLTKGVYSILADNSIGTSLSIIKKDHFKLYSKFGGFNIEKELNGYGHLDNNFVITSWDVSQISKFFKKAFLNI